VDATDVYEYTADMIMMGIANKLKAMEESGKGFHVDGDVTASDRLIVVLGTFDKRHLQRALDVEVTKNEIRRVMSIFEKYGVELTPGEAYVLGKIRKYIVLKLRHGVVSPLDMIDEDYAEISGASRRAKQSA